MKAELSARAEVPTKNDLESYRYTSPGETCTIGMNMIHKPSGFCGCTTAHTTTHRHDHTHTRPHTRPHAPTHTYLNVCIYMVDKQPGNQSTLNLSILSLPEED